MILENATEAFEWFSDGVVSVSEGVQQSAIHQYKQFERELERRQSDKTIISFEITELSLANLADRLKVSKGLITRKRRTMYRKQFQDWTSQNDPDGWGWRYWGEHYNDETDKQSDFYKPIKTLRTYKQLTLF